MVELIQPREAREDSLEVCYVGLVAGGHCVWCLVVVVTFMGLEGGENYKSIIWGGNASHKKDNFYGKDGFLLCNTTILKLYCKFYWVLKSYYKILPLSYITSAVLPVLYLY